MDGYGSGQKSGKGQPGSLRQMTPGPYCSPLLPFAAGQLYVYLPELEALARCHCRGGGRLLHQLPQAHTPSPLNGRVWEAALRTHPDHDYARYIVQGIQEGFRIGFHEGQLSLRPAIRNIPSAYEQPQIVDKYLQAECAQGRVLGPLPPPPIPELHISRFGVIPKRSQPGKWRLIVDLSAPDEHSVNAGIPTELCSLRYPSLDAAARLIMTQGRGALMSKLDIKEAYRMVPVHPDDWFLLGMRWRGAYYIDTRLPFGLRSAPKIFTALADALQWILLQRGLPNLLHYLDDFLFVESPGAPGVALEVACSTCAALGVPIAPEKLEGPTTCVTFLGIELDSSHLVARLPADKLARVQHLVAEWGDKKVCTKRELLSLIGILQHAATVVRFGRFFLRRMIDLSTSVREMHHHIRLNRAFRADLQWWALFAPRWNGSSFLLPALQAHPDITVYSDASGSWGYGAWTGPLWFQGQWPASWATANITVKELLPIVLAAAVWGPGWCGKAVEFQCDNQAIVSTVNYGRTHEPKVAHFLRGLALFAMEFGFHVRAAHIAGIDNVAADALSRNHMPTFLAQTPQAHPHPTVIPEDLQVVFLQQQPDWLSSEWRQRCRSFLQQAWLTPQLRPTL